MSQIPRGRSRYYLAGQGANQALPAMHGVEDQRAGVECASLPFRGDGPAGMPAECVEDLRLWGNVLAQKVVAR